MVGSFFRTFAALAVVAGLVLGHSAFASCGMSGMDMSAKIARTASLPGATAADAASEDMECCPKTHSGSAAPKCPLMALCAAPLAGPTFAVLVPTVVAAVYRQPEPIDEPDLAGLTAVPLPKPPRSTV